MPAQHRARGANMRSSNITSIIIGLLVACALLPKIGFANILNGEPYSVTTHQNGFMVNGEYKLLRGGSLQWFRLPPESWEDRLKRFKSAGFNTVDMYVAWNQIERTNNQFDFDTPDIRRFLELCQSLGLYVYFRPGPYITNELDGGGIPGWLTDLSTKKSVKADGKPNFRTDDPDFLFYVERYLGRLNEVISPYHFMDVAKLSGLLPEITRMMIDKSFKIMSNNDYSFSLNITEDDLSQNYLLEFLSEKAAQYKIAPHRVILEILEGVSASGKKNHIKQLTQLKAWGYSLAIDDFGTEYSNFERILELDIDYLKIDAKYIKDIDINEKSYEITRAITFFAHNASIPCIAEFVHNESVQTVVNTLGIDYSQGYYFSEPAAEPTITL